MGETTPNVDALRSAISGSAAVCLPGDPGYDEAVTIWNAAR